MLTGIGNLIRIIGNLPPTYWGVLILFASMYMAVHGAKIEEVYYFAGVGSTLTGISHFTPKE